MPWHERIPPVHASRWSLPLACSVGLMPYPMHLHGAEMTFTDTIHVVLMGATVPLLILLSIGLGAVAYRGKWFRLCSIGTLMTLLEAIALIGFCAAQLAA
jgi:hypothetical protein